MRNRREQAIAVYAEYWPVDAMLEMLLSTQMGKQELAELVYAMRHLPVIQPVPHEVKVIGMFYYRMYNGGVERVMALLSTIFVQHGYHVVIFTDRLRMSWIIPCLRLLCALCCLVSRRMVIRLA